jgi:hypothetical protein
MALPHYTQSKVSTNLYEPVHSNLFEVTLMSPLKPDSALILEHVKSIGGMQGVNPSVDAVGQKYKFSDRSFAGMPQQTYVDLSIVFTLNLNSANEMYLYKQIKDWYAIAYNPATGEMGLKVEYVGTVIVVQHNRRGDIFRKITFTDAFPQGQLEALDQLDYETTDPQEMTMTIRSDHWTEELT